VEVGLKAKLPASPTGAAQTRLSLGWQAPWLAPFAPAGQSVAQRIEAGASFPDALNQQLDTLPAAAPKPAVRFVPQSALPPETAYEDFIFKTGQVPTRDNLHDFFNGLCWMHFPKTKQRLNQLQAQQIAQDGVRQVRGPVRDAITLFDENAAFLRAPDELWEALAQKDWETLFVTRRVLWKQAALTLFGHALLEKLASPRKGITAHVYRVHPVTDSLADLDIFVANDLSAEKIAGKPFAHLPVLGVPGWWPGNEAPAFYDDKSVFRKLRAPPQNLTFHRANP
jgi:hypothetical protein